MPRLEPENPVPPARSALDAAWADVSAGRSGRARRVGVWILGLLALAAVLAGVLHFRELEDFARLARQAKPAWLLVAVGLQILTYLCVAAAWQRALRATGHEISLRSLMPLSLAKLFTDQAVPTGGFSGALLVARALIGRGIPPPAGLAALLAGFISYHAASLLAALTALALLYFHDAASAAYVSILLAFAAVAVVLPNLAFLLAKLPRGGRLLRWARRLRSVDLLERLLRDSPIDLLRQPRLLLSMTLFQLAVFYLDAATLWALVAATGQEGNPGSVFAALVMGSATAALGPIPLGLGTFEAACVTTLHTLGTPLEAALTATLLLRGMTVWLPMLPGLWCARRELRRLPRPQAAPGRSA